MTTSHSGNDVPPSDIDRAERIQVSGKDHRVFLSEKSIQAQTLDALEADEQGAEWAVLVALVEAVVSGRAIEPRFQAVVNAIIVKAVGYGRLPPQKKGRPVSTDGIDGERVAERYFEMRDGGMPFEQAVRVLEGEFHKDERHLMRLVKANKQLIGITPEAREKRRKWLRRVAEMLYSVGEAGHDSVIDRILDPSKLAEVDWQEKCEELIDQALAFHPSTDKK